MLIGRKALGTVAYMGGVPALLERFCWSWGQMVQWTNESLCSPTEYVHWGKTSFSDHGPARNSLAAKFVGDWLIQLDTDHSFDPDLVERLVTTANKYNLDVLTGVYMMKNDPIVPVLFQWVHMNDGVALQPIAKWNTEARLLQIGSAGAGCLFVRRRTFDRIVNELKQQPFDKIAPYSEDHSFFYRCRKLGIKCYALMDLECKHLKVSEVSLSDMDISKFSISEPFEVEGYHG